MSGSVLQIAPCYLEDFHAKAPEVIKEDKNGKDIHDEPDLSR